MKQYPLLLFLLTLTFFSAAQSVNWQDKVDGQVLNAAMNGLQVEYLVLMEQQADVSKAAMFRTKEDKGRYVFEQLKDLAARDQRQVIALAEQHQALYHSYWIVNTLWVKSELSLIEAIASLPEVQGIHPNPSLPFDGPVSERRADVRDPQAIEWGITNIGADNLTTAQSIVPQKP